MRYKRQQKAGDYETAMLLKGDILTGFQQEAPKSIVMLEQNVEEIILTKHIYKSSALLFTIRSRL